MRKQITGLLSIFIFTGILVSCGGTSDPFVENAIKNRTFGNYQAIVEDADSVIAQDPDNGLAYYYKGVALGDIAAQTQPPSDRESIYIDMKQNLEKAASIFDTLETKPSEANNINNVIVNSWGQEFNLGIEYVTNDSLLNSEPNALDKAANHLQNAITINPDSVRTYEVLAEIERRRENYGAAGNALQNVIELKNPPSADDYYRTATFYLLDEQYQPAVNLLEEGIEMYPDSISLTEQIADAYRGIGEDEKAISTIQTLIDRNPDNAQYRLVLGTQIYQNVLDNADKYSANVDQIFELEQKQRQVTGDEKEAIENQVQALVNENSKLLQEINSQTERAENELLEVISLDPNNFAAYNTLGIIYQNKAATLFEARNQETDNEEASRLDREAKAELKKATEYYEQAVEIQPDNTDVWRALANAYVTLDMQDKAREALQKAEGN